ncbi:MAG: TIGR00341 family protein [Maricaulaceae bacterium]
MRFIKANFPADKCDAIQDIVEKAKPIDWSLDEGYGRYEKAIEIVVAKGCGQDLIDNLQSLLCTSPDWRVVVMPIEATLPRPPEPENGKNPDSNSDKDAAAKKAKTTALREELYQKVSSDCNLNSDFIILTVLSAIVAAIGLNGDNVAIVIAAMVIAPLLGPILAFALATALGDLSLMKKATKTAIAGLGIGFGFALALSIVFPLNPESYELSSRTVISPEIIALALASGAAAALSLSTGISSALVGVMVAVALLPPSVTSALYLGAGEYDKAAGAALLLGLNVVCAVLSAQLVFVYKGIRPRRWYSQKKAATAVKINITVWVSLIIAMVLIATQLTDVIGG